MIANRRILLVDDNDAIHTDFHKILAAGSEEPAGGARAAFLGSATVARPGLEGFLLTSARQGQEALAELERAITEERRYAMAFVDVRMPPGWDGVETISHLWKADPHLQVVICTAYSDYSLEEIVAKLGQSDRLLILKKPFDPVEVRQLANALTVKWSHEERVRLQVEALERANREAEAASRAKSDFIANMSHEIRTPMTAILGYTDLICDPTIGSAEKDGYASIVRRSGEHLLTILNDVLDISKIEAGKLSVLSRRFSPIELCKEGLALMSVRAEEKGLGLSLETSGRLPLQVESDPVRVRQILLNLLGNAIKFTDQGSVRLVIAYQIPPRGSEPMLKLDVVDTGCGIAAEDRSRLFEAFSQADVSSTRTAGGTGLGLTISRRLARILGGDIEFESEERAGSTFRVWIAVGGVEDADLVVVDADELASAHVPSAARPSLELRGRILLVEDTRLNQVLIVTILGKAGAAVEIASNGEEGCLRVAEADAAGHPFELIVMDMQMPVLDGYAATRRLREAGVATPIIALTAHAMAEDRDKCLEAGCNDYVTKPVDKDGLVATCARWLLPSGDNRDPEAPLPQRGAFGRSNPRASGDPRPPR